MTNANLPSGEITKVMNFFLFLLGNVIGDFCFIFLYYLFTIINCISEK